MGKEGTLLLILKELVDDIGCLQSGSGTEEKRADHLLVFGQGREDFSGRFPEFANGGRAVIGQVLSALGIREDQLHRIELGSVGGQRMHRQAFAHVEAREEILHLAAAMDRSAVPHEKEAVGHGRQEVHEHAEHARGIEGASNELEEQIEAGRHGDENREFLPVERKANDGRLAARRPSPAHERLLGKPTFVNKDNGFIFFERLFF